MASSRSTSPPGTWNTLILSWLGRCSATSQLALLSSIAAKIFALSTSVTCSQIDPVIRGLLPPCVEDQGWPKTVRNPMESLYEREVQSNVVRNRGKTDPSSRLEVL